MSYAKTYFHRVFSTNEMQHRLRRVGVIQSSLRDLDSPSRNPTLERVGYSQISHPGDGRLPLREGDDDLHVPEENGRIYLPSGRRQSEASFRLSSTRKCPNCGPSPGGKGLGCERRPKNFHPCQRSRCFVFAIYAFCCGSSAFSSFNNEDARAYHASNFFATSPATSVRRKSRP